MKKLPYWFSENFTLQSHCPGGLYFPSVASMHRCGLIMSAKLIWPNAFQHSSTVWTNAFSTSESTCLLGSLYINEQHVFGLDKEREREVKCKENREIKWKKVGDSNSGEQSSHLHMNVDIECSRYMMPCGTQLWLVSNGSNLRAQAHHRLAVVHQ